MLPQPLVMVPRFPSRNSLRPVHRIKHVIDSQGGLALGVIGTTNLALAVDAPVLGNQADVQTGSTINGIFLVVEVYGTTSGALSNVYMTLGKNPGGLVNLPQPNLVGISDAKRYVIHQEMVMLQKVTNSNPRTLFKGVIAIPRGYRRNGPDDRWQLSLFAPGVNIDFCIQAHYKKFR